MFDFVTAPDVNEALEIIEIPSVVYGNNNNFLEI